MSKLGRFQKEWEKVARLAGHNRIVEARAEVERMLECWPDNPPLLLMKANLIQLGDNGPELALAKTNLLRAAELDSQAPNPHVELGHFCYAVADDAKAALTHFDQAIALCRDLLQDALSGKAKALAELERREEALACLAEAYFVQARADAPRKNANGQQILDQLQELKLAE